MAECLRLCLVKNEVSLLKRFPTPSIDDIISGFVPPAQFSDVRFENYLPDALHPSQFQTLTAMCNFAGDINRGNRSSIFRRKHSSKQGRYLDGGFGVGKTHLLAALWHEVNATKLYGTFVEYTNLVGLLGFHNAADVLSKYQLICIDEFELDDPGDTVLMSTLLMKLVGSGTFLAATSNTLPDRLGEERFATENFQREIQGLSKHFESLRIDGEDYRHRDLEHFPLPMPDEVLKDIALSNGFEVVDSAALSQHLSSMHPSRYRFLLSQLQGLGLASLETITNQDVALRWVIFIDRLYDLSIPVVYSGTSLGELFSPELLQGGYRKKYRRALSRIVALAQGGLQLWSIQDSNL